MQLRIGKFQLKSVIGRKKIQNLPMRSGILFASTEFVHRPRLTLIYTLIIETYHEQTRMEK